MSAADFCLALPTAYRLVPAIFRPSYQVSAVGKDTNDEFTHFQLTIM